MFVLGDIQEVYLGVLYGLHTKDVPARCLVFLANGQGYSWYSAESWRVDPMIQANFEPTEDRISPFRWQHENGCVILTFSQTLYYRCDTIVLRQANGLSTFWVQVSPSDHNAVVYHRDNTPLEVNPIPFMQVFDRLRLTRVFLPDSCRVPPAPPAPLPSPPQDIVHQGPMTRSRKRASTQQVPIN